MQVINIANIDNSFPLVPHGKLRRDNDILTIDLWLRDSDNKYRQALFRINDLVLSNINDQQIWQNHTRDQGQ